MYVFGFVSLFANSERLAIFFYAKVYTVIEAGTRGPPHWFYYPGFYDHAS